MDSELLWIATHVTRCDVAEGAGAETEGHPGGFVLILRRKINDEEDYVNDRNSYINGDNFNELILYKD